MIALSIALAASGCMPDFAEPEDFAEPATPFPYTRLFVSLENRRVASDSLFFSAYLTLATDSSGKVAEVADHAIVIGGLVVLPTRESEGTRQFRYNSRLLRSDDQATLEIRLPLVDGATGAIREIEVPLIATSSISHIELPRGEDLALPVTFGDLGTGLERIVGSRVASVSIHVPGTAYQITIGAQPPVEAAWRIPGEWFTAAPSDTVEVRLIVHDELVAGVPVADVYSPPAGAYVVRVRRATFIQWTVVVKDDRG